MTDAIHQMFRDKMGRRLAEDFDRAFSVVTTQSTTETVKPFTYEDLLECKRLLDNMPPSPCVDLWPHDLPDVGVVELKELAFEIFDRRQIVVPRLRLEEIAIELRRAGVDVRVQPKIAPMNSSEKDSVDE